MGIAYMNTLPAQLFWSSAGVVNHSIHPSESCVLYLGHTGLQHHQNNVVFQHQFYSSPYQSSAIALDAHAAKINGISKYWVAQHWEATGSVLPPRLAHRIISYE